jgi:DNA helicase-2/ATP-dependent DNA helicase PcrA
MKPSQHQQAILDEIRSGTGNLFINAVAGSGKSTLIRMIAESLYQPDSFEKDILAIAFNSHITKELSGKMPPNTKVATMHSVGLEAWKNYAGKVQVDQFKTGNVMSKYFDMNKPDEKFRYYRWRGSFAKIIGLFKAKDRAFWSKTQNIESLGNDIVAEYDIKLPKLAHYEVAIYWDMLKNVWDSCNRLKNIIDFDDMIYLPVINNVPMPHYRLVLVDESQDMNPIQIDFVLDMGSRTVAVGDPKQSIYAFRGADSQAIESYIKRSDAKSFPLSVCYRCAKSIVASAKKYVPQIESAPDAPEGQVADTPTDGYRKLVKDGDYVLCRCTAPLVKDCLLMIREGRKATVKGKDIGAKLIELVEDISKNDNESSKDFHDKLKAYQSAQLEKLERANRELEIIQLTDRVETLAVILEECNTVSDIKYRIQNIFSDTATTGITFCTVHKAKGLESTNIFIIEPSLMPHPSAKSPVAMDQEKNIIYVAITRAKQNLYWVRGAAKPEVKQEYKDSLVGKNLSEPTRFDDPSLEVASDDDPMGISIVGIVSGRVQAQVPNLSVIPNVVTITIPNLSIEAAKSDLDKVYDKDDSTADLQKELKNKIASGENPEKALFDMLTDLENSEEDALN